MIDIIKQDNNTIHYKCTCGSVGICSFKPQAKDAAIVMNIICPVCNEMERVNMVQYSSEQKRQELKEVPDNMDLSWSPTFSQEV